MAILASYGPRSILLSSRDMDKVILKNLRFDLVVGLDAWRRWNKPQPVLISLEVQPASNFEAAAAKDDVNLTMDYGKLYKKISAGLALVAQFATVQMLITQISELVTDYLVLEIEIVLPKAILEARAGVLYRSQFDKSSLDTPAFSLSMSIQKIACDCIIGVNPHERLYKQSLFFDISVPFVGSVVPSSDNAEDSEKLHNMVQEVTARVEGSSYLTVEALATAVAQIVTMTYGHTMAKIRVEKPSAIATIEAAAVEITRSRSFFENKDFWKVKLP